MKNKIKILLFVLSILSVGSVNAASFSVSFPSFNGNYIYPNGVVEDSFDLGVQFSAIQSASLTIEASGTAGLLQICTGSLCTTQSYGQDLVWGFLFETGHNSVFGSQSLTDTAAPYIFDITSQSSFLLDGAGGVFIQPNFIVSVPETIVTILKPSSYQISNVVLSVEGTAVPVPPALLLFLSGLTSLLGLSSKLRKNGLTNQSNRR
jgi:hypothetical protein